MSARTGTAWQNEQILALEAENAELRQKVGDADAADDLAETAWGIIANASDWLEGTGKSDVARAEWVAAAERWRDRYHLTLRPAEPLRRYDSETGDDLRPYIQAFAQAYCFAPNAAKVVDIELGQTVAILFLRAAREASDG